MHELSIAHSIVEIASEVARKEHSPKVEIVFLSVGELSCVSSEALDFAFEVAARGTPAQGARLEIERKPVVVRCADCRKDSTLDSLQRFICSACGRPASQIVSGRELNVERIQLEVACASG